jgi:PQQ-dependent catabolism-associated beta-propeller protein
MLLTQRYAPVVLVILLLAVATLFTSATVRNGRTAAGAPADGASAPADNLHSSGGRGSLIFVSNEGSHDISVVDPAQGKEIQRIRLNGRARGIQMSADGKLLYVALSDDVAFREGEGDVIAVIDVAELKIIRSTGAGSDPEQFALSPDGEWLFASNEDAGTATATDLRTGEKLATVVVGIEPEGVAVSPDGRWVYVTAETSNTISAVDAHSLKVVSSFLVGARPRSVAFSPDGTRAWATAEIDGTVSVIDVATHRVIHTIVLEGGNGRPVGIVVSTDGKTVFVANGGADCISVIDAVSYEPISRIETGRRPWGIALSADGTRLYVANGGSNDISMIDTRRRRVIQSIKVGTRPWGVAVR